MVIQARQVKAREQFNCRPPMLLLDFYKSFMLALNY